jgi:hypothetical protein
MVLISPLMKAPFARSLAKIGAGTPPGRSQV